MNNMDLTILIPTMNRYGFLARALEYYRIVGYNGWIIIGDSSNEECLRKNMDLVATTKELNIIYRTYANPPYLHTGMCIKKMNEEIPTKYVIFQGDDDFFIVSALQQCIEVLEQLSDEFVAAHGKRLNMKISHDKPYGPLNYIYELFYKHNHVADDDPLVRWQAYIEEPISNQFWVQRTNVWKKAYERVDLVPDHYLGTELLPCSLLTLLGKAKELECVSSVHQIQETNIFDLNRQSLFDCICTDGWATSMRVCKQTLMDNGVPSDMVHSALWGHIIYWMTKQYQRIYKRGKEDFNTNLPQGDEVDDARVKFNSEWLYYEEFLPIFNFLTKKGMNE